MAKSGKGKGGGKLVPGSLGGNSTGKGGGKKGC